MCNVIAGFESDSTRQLPCSSQPNWAMQPRQPVMPALPGLLHSPSMVALGLSVRYETWPPIGCFADSVIGWSIYSPGNTSHQMHYGLTWPVGISTGFQTPLTVSLHSLTAGKLPAVRLCKGTVKESTVLPYKPMAQLIMKVPDVTQGHLSANQATDHCFGGLKIDIY